MNQKERLALYGSTRGQPTLDHGDGDLPPSYETTVRQPSSSKLEQPWSTQKKIAVVGFVLIQVVLVVSVLKEFFNEELNRANIHPQQLHLSLGKNDNEYYVSWATRVPAECHLVWSREGSTLTKALRGELKKALFEDVPEDTKKPFVDYISFSETTVRKYFYHARMTVTPGETYSYHIAAFKPNITDSDAEEIELSKTYTFKALPYNDSTRPLEALFYGDLGLKNAQSLPRLTEEVQSKRTDLIIHNGDFAYDLNTDRGKVGDRFMRLMEPIAARVPYQTSVGNHEIASNFSYYDSRFTMINRGPINFGQKNNFFYSFNAGPVHFVSFSTEFYYFLDYVGIVPLINQYDWLKADLEEANKPESRLKHPWLIVFGHRPMYCSSRDNDDCSKDSNLLRRGLPITGGYALEKLFYDYGVDVELYSHEHQYERFLPIYDGKVRNGTDNIKDPYRNPLAPVHIISGSAGCEEKIDPFEGHPVTGSVKQIADYGYTKIHASSCQIRFEQISDDKAGTIVDEFIISKDRQNFPPKSSKVKYDHC